MNVVSLPCTLSILFHFRDPDLVSLSSFSQSVYLYSRNMILRDESGQLEANYEDGGERREARGEIKALRGF